ncbi:hypothetical protein [Streptomyces scabiei]|uniref:hypothetical protein n=1 Tax=Streptomyces scabiei TaxID=1930 RepID=UPI0029A2BD8F|nr:hypothetical protein [Streptomyces scabiei]MDX2800087.1 hypothetical protein [Streptomyces scabiei]
MANKKREYEGTGGLRIHLDDPPTPEMAKQIAKGALRPVDGKDADVEAGNKALVVVDGADATTASRVGVHRRSPGEKPGDDATAGQWATYAVALGMESTQASTLSLAQLQEWVAEHEKALGEGQDTPVPTTDPETPVEPLPEKPAKNAVVADWRAYAIELGMDPDEAKDATKTECQEYAQVVEDARAEQQPDPETEE